MEQKDFDYTFKKDYSYIETSVLKQKEVSNIMGIIASGRLKHFIEFSSYGVCEYDEDDKQLINAHVTLTDKFNRLRTNVLVYDVFDNDWSHGVYDKLFIFKTNWPRESKFNFVFFNSKTGKSSHYPEIEYAYDILAQDIMKYFNSFHRKEIFDFYRMKKKASNENNFTDECNDMNFPAIKERYESAQWDKRNEQKTA